MKFVSNLKISVKAGNGGNGIIAWRRESKVRFGGPAGGNGGNGGSVIFVSTKNLNSLFHLQSKKHYFAKSGENGRNKSQHGANAEHLYIRVPCGTNIYEANSNMKLIELLCDEQTYVASVGGKGGKGNVHFKCSTNPTPFMNENGDQTKEQLLLLDLQCIADVGFLGCPNAGKSTLLCQISNAQPKIAPFPFTTMIPVLGTVEWEGKKSVFADIPGLIEGASEGLGLGFEFLKHLNRCRVLLHIVAGNSENLIQEIFQIEEELKKYSDFLYQKPRLLIINKIDELTDQQLIEIKKQVSKNFTQKTIYISAKEKQNLDELLKASFDLLSEFPSETPDEPNYLEFNDDPLNNEEIEVIKKDGLIYVKNAYLEYWINKIPANTNDNIKRILYKLEGFELEKKLRKNGVDKGQEINIYGFQYPCHLINN